VNLAPHESSTAFLTASTSALGVLPSLDAFTFIAFLQLRRGECRCHDKCRESYEYLSQDGTTNELTFFCS
jgi:hypothetical protein